MGISAVSVISAPSGITEDTETRFCSPIPALMSAMSKALRSDTSLTAELLVMKNFEGTSSMFVRTIGRSYRCRYQRFVFRRIPRILENVFKFGMVVLGTWLMKSHVQR